MRNGKWAGLQVEYHLWVKRKPCLSSYVGALAFIAVKRHHDHSSTYKGNHLKSWLIVSEVQFIIIMVGPGSMQSDMVLGSRVPHLDLKATRNELR